MKSNCRTHTLLSFVQLSSLTSYELDKLDVTPTTLAVEAIDDSEQG
jgi:hypothetical protein